MEHLTAVTALPLHVKYFNFKRTNKCVNVTVKSAYTLLHNYTFIQTAVRDRDGRQYKNKTTKSAVFQGDYFYRFRKWVSNLLGQWRKC